MCAAAIARAGIPRVVFGARNEKFGGCGSVLHCHTTPTYVPALQLRTARLHSCYDHCHAHMHM
ncbi:hypothetical protein EON67_02120 [archaeon]|nr:MAG: hypothetical protein EON67_02120 [archaeon]